MKRNEKRSRAREMKNLFAKMSIGEFIDYMEERETEITIQAKKSMVEHVVKEVLNNVKEAMYQALGIGEKRFKKFEDKLIELMDVEND